MSTTFLIYNYDSDLLLSGSFEVTSESDSNKITTVTPPETTEYEIAKFNEDDFSWIKIPDYRGFVYYTHEEGSVEITDINVTPPEDAIAFSDADEIVRNEDGTWRLIIDAEELVIHKNLLINTNQGFGQEFISLLFYAENFEYRSSKQHAFTMRFIELKDKADDNDPASPLTTEEVAELDNLTVVNNFMNAIMAAEAATTIAITNQYSISEVNSVAEITWPEGVDEGVLARYLESIPVFMAQEANQSHLNN